ncbi:hypothetical protein HZB06_00605 [Candidatus Wolfebacteria bacterium]|nr:hypothetical protein [Candidatus Wolfebacteria bacterium]
MSLVLKINLVAHIVVGLVAVAAFYAVLINLLKRRLNFRFLRFSSLAGAVGIFLSWLTGGYYYAVYYGQAVKPVIKKSGYPWIHNVLMEAKEHVFLFLPFIAIILVLIIWFLESEILANEKLKKYLILTAGAAVVLGTLIVLMGMAISGAANIKNG